MNPEQLSELIHAVTLLALVGGVVGAAAYDLCRSVVSAVASRLKQRQRERAFFADLGDYRG